ncbi:MAG: patatin-like phospholipase family protein [Planctomycetes bacterium]|nr:patatin-like phospholipase family protein [Planctomycetota bacterium]
MQPRKITRGLLLSGGGARAAYQAGVLRHILEVSREPLDKIPFEILVGASAGAINLAGLAAHAGSFRAACELMVRHWETLSTQKVFEAKANKIAANVFRWILDLALGGAEKRREPRGKALLDTTPLARLVEGLLPPGAIAGHLARGTLEAVAVSATDYDSGAHTVFVQASASRKLWQRYSRIAHYDQITPAHILASCALPILFPAVRIGNSYYGDGSIRNTAPLSPAIHLGASKILAIGVREVLNEPIEPSAREREPRYPTAARISGVLFDSIFLDALESDWEQMVRINRLLENLPRAVVDDRGAPIQPIEFLYVGPSQKLSDLAFKHRNELPRIIRYLLRGLGAKGKGSGVLYSYILFESAYCRELMELGYRDAQASSEKIQKFLWG